MAEIKCVFIESPARLLVADCQPTQSVCACVGAQRAANMAVSADVPWNPKKSSRRRNARRFVRDCGGRHHHSTAEATRAWHVAIKLEPDVSGWDASNRAEVSIDDGLAAADSQKFGSWVTATLMAPSASATMRSVLLS
jgi:PhoPQ-activated pathogenicity-related protein